MEGPFKYLTDQSEHSSQVRDVVVTVTVQGMAQCRRCPRAPGRGGIATLSFKLEVGDGSDWDSRSESDAPDET
jgi:hypothetical protein